MKSYQWKKDRNRLRDIIRETKPKFQGATLLYCLVSHMRDKLHMNWYKKYHGGFPNPKKMSPGFTIPQEIHQAYSGSEHFYYARCALTSLSDQEAWIRWCVAFKINEDIKEIANRVLVGYEEEELQKTG